MTRERPGIEAEGRYSRGLGEGREATEASAGPGPSFGGRLDGTPEADAKAEAIVRHGA